jgi:hypothetical protein
LRKNWGLEESMESQDVCKMVSLVSDHRDWHHHPPPPPHHHHHHRYTWKSLLYDLEITTYEYFNFYNDFIRSYLLRLPSRTILESCEAAKLAETVPVPLVPLVPIRPSKEWRCGNATSESSESSPEKPFESQWFNARHCKCSLAYSCRSIGWSRLNSHRNQYKLNVSLVQTAALNFCSIFKLSRLRHDTSWDIMRHHGRSWDILIHDPNQS